MIYIYVHVLPWFIVVHFISAIEFYIEEENKLPKQVRYAIRLDSYWSTASTYPVFASDGPTNW